MVLVTGFIVFMERGQRRIPVQYAKRVVGRKIYGGQNTYLPLRVNTGGVIPVIFASSVVMIPTTISGLFSNQEWLQWLSFYLGFGQPLHYALYVAAIVFFSYFYVSIIFNPADTAENMRKYGGFIPGIRSGRRTSEYIDRILTRLTLVGALYLSAVSVLPEFLLSGVQVGGLPFIGEGLEARLPAWFTQGMGINFYFGGTSLLIVVSVAMDTVQQVESQLVMRNYDGLLKRGRIRGRRG
jgi:preprotein translocase subunit SecY